LIPFLPFVDVVRDGDGDGDGRAHVKRETRHRLV
jgi:hypothetical protein